MRDDALWKSSVGLLFDRRSEIGKPMSFHLDRPLDIDPAGRSMLDVETIADIVREAAGVLHAAGLRSGDRFVVYKQNHFDCTLLAAAGIRIGAIPVLLSGALPDDAVRPLLERAEPTLLVSDEPRLTRKGDDGDSLASFAERTLRVGEGHSGTLCYDELHGAASPEPTPRGDDELMMLTHTSGTTGVPKLIMYTAAKLQGQMARMECTPLPPITFRRSDTLAMFTPYVHARAFTWIYSLLTLAPTRVLLMSDSRPEVVEPMFERYRPTMVEALPVDYARLERTAANPRSTAFAHVRLFVSNFDTIRWSMIRTFMNATRHRFPLWREGYGQSETGGLGMSVVTRGAANRRREELPGPRKVARPIPGFMALKVVDPTTFEPLRNGTAGLVLARTRARCIGYYREPERWQEKVVGDWWNTGDIGLKTPTGALKILDREVNYAPGTSSLEHEDVIVDRLPEGYEVALLPVPDGPPVPIVAAPDRHLDPARWARAVRGLPPVAEPIVIDFEDLPRTGTGKIRRHELRRRQLETDEQPGSGQWT